MSNIIVQTDQSGANDPINTSNSKIYNFTIGTSNTINEGTFEIKRGIGSTNGITATIFNSFDASGSALSSVFVSVSSIT